MGGLLLGAAMRWYEHRHWRPSNGWRASPIVAQHRCAAQVARREPATPDSASSTDLPTFERPRSFASGCPCRTTRRCAPTWTNNAVPARRRSRWKPPLFYAQTSGTTGAPKLIPITPAMLAVHRAEQAPVLLSAIPRVPGGVRGQGPRHHGRGRRGPSRFRPRRRLRIRTSLSGSLPRVVQSRFVVPPEVSSHDGLRSEVPRHPAPGARRSPTSPTWARRTRRTFLRLLDVLNARRDVLLRVARRPGRFDAARGCRRRRCAMSSTRRLKPRPGSRARLRAHAGADVRERLARHPAGHDLDGGSCGIALDAAAREAASRRRGHGARVSGDRVPRHDRARVPKRRAGLPPLHHHFFEFVEQDAAGTAATRNSLTLDRLEAGRRYYVLITTTAGLVPLLHERPDRGHGHLSSNAAAALRSEGQGRDQPHRREAVRGADHPGGSRRRIAVRPGASVFRAGRRRRAVGVSPLIEPEGRTPPDAQARSPWRSTGGSAS